VKTRTIKDVDERTWEILRRFAKKKKVKMGTLLRHMASEYEKVESMDLSKFIPDKPIISADEAEELEQIVINVRREEGFRQ
jgi:hypothetical protein